MMKNIFLKLTFNILKNSHNFPERMKTEKVEKLVAKLQEKRIKKDRKKNM